MDIGPAALLVFPAAPTRTGIISSGLGHAAWRPLGSGVLGEHASDRPAELCVLGHPSGDPAPSPDDVALTRNLAAAGMVIGVPFADHIVIGNGRYFSFKEMGVL